MPSHSKKQHNFMEAIAHSPSFAKKAGVPQSVGKDFAAADKGKTFSKGGEMKESKGMVGKEVAFMKKKGAPKSMLKHEMSEMKGMKAGGKVRRMAGGGMGDPFERDTDYEAEKAQGAKNLEGIKSFFGFGKKEEKEAPVPRPSLSPSLLKFNKEEPSASTSRVSNQSPRTRRESEDTSASDAAERNDAAAMDKTAKGPQYTSSIATEGGEYSGSGFPAFKPEKSVTRTRKPVGIEKTVKKERVITEPVSKTPFKSDSPDLESREESMKPKRKFGMASDETRASVRKGLGSVLDFFDLSKAHEREFGKKMAKGGNVKMDEGGYAKADGAANKGKTQPKMVKMASGGYVKNADGCAQRGKTKAFQVKMNRGGMC